ncbi:hypothetical protein [Methanobacterium sp.]|uniref:hypothetical protein n=1 Tax=Methanobacterium sp. TaxID=2164 RepID=UPI002AB86D62|nr:hypothetical protein [Methanobacterium sp.]MDY9922796.1 hypothetical protein [Methanobacterium sp.]
MIAKCKECGKEYELKFGQRTSNFQCECGGDLRKLTFRELYKENEERLQNKEPKITYQQQTDKTLPQAEATTQQHSTDKPQSSPGDVSKGNTIDWFNKQSRRSKTVMGLFGCCIGIILIIGISGILSSDITTSSATYTGSAMSFQYPSTWTVSPGSGTTMVSINKGDMEVGVDLMSTSVQAEENAMISEDYYLVEEKSASGTNYKVYRTKRGIEVTVFLFEKNGKVFEVVGHSNNAAVMERIVASIH